MTYLRVICCCFATRRQVSVCNSCCIVVDGLLIMSTSMDALLEGVNAEFGGIKQQVPPRPRPSPHLLSPGLLILTMGAVAPAPVLGMPLGPASRVCPRYALAMPPLTAASAPAPFSHLHPASLGLSPRPSGWHTSRSSAHGRQWHAPSLHPKAWDRHGARPRRAPGRAREPGPRYPLLSPTHSPTPTATVVPSELAPAAPSLPYSHPDL